MEGIMVCLQNVFLYNDRRDIWRWKLNKEGGFVVKELTRILEERILDAENAGEDTIWLKLVPNKVNIFVWKALKRRLPVREELDNRGVDLDTVLKIHVTLAHLEKKRTRLRIHEEVLFTERGDGVTGIKRRRRDLSNDGVRDLAMASGRDRLKEDIESST
ncbi:RNA-directed DNA polymerase, eukaryota, reverse transcriptase zinc-binding domain protein [Tanacetum coccineum]|uniref:RNA-directed DNA polymerase, eukaryota, reverse transcriptase zinc-binding domain protein n=1 Tax=Tanacetum coccineum TaxID=301880 RepID=A0ABQ5C3T7_9ASTR